MIKFFRKIRQKLMSENNFSKYLIYAIGEIVLVVIGILIALSINNWNEGHKIKKTEKEILQNLNIELQANHKDLKAINDQHKTEFEDGMSILNIFGSDISSIPTLK